MELHGSSEETESNHFPSWRKGKWHLVEGQHRGHEQLRMFLECIPSNILTQVTKELMTGDAVMDLILTEKELARVVKAEGSLGYRDHKFKNGVQDPEMRDQGKKQDHKL